MTLPPRLDHRRLRTLLIAWAAAVVVPGILAWPWTLRGHNPLFAYLVWTVGYFLQLFLFATIARLTQTTAMAPWLVASTLPWIVDVTVPRHPWGIVLFTAAAAGFAAWLYQHATAVDRLLHDGVEGTGTVVEVVEPKSLNVVVNNGYVKRSVRLTVERPDKQKSYEAVLRDLFKVDELPKPGDRIALRVDPADATRIMALPPVDESRGNGGSPD